MEAFWNTKNGAMIRIADMETSHIQNCIHMIERNWDELPDRDVYLVGEHESLPAVAVLPGKTLELRGLSKSIWQAKRLAVLGKHAAATLAGDNTAIRAANEEREQIDKQLKMWEKNNGNN